MLATSNVELLVVAVSELVEDNEGLVLVVTLLLVTWADVLRKVDVDLDAEVVDEL